MKNWKSGSIGQFYQTNKTRKLHRKSWSDVNEEGEKYGTKSTLNNDVEHTIMNQDLLSTLLNYRHYLKNDAIERDKVYQAKRENEANRLKEEREKMMNMMVSSGISHNA